MEENKAQEQVQENQKEVVGTEINNQKKIEKTETVKVTIVDFTAFSTRGETVFFNKTMEQIRFELFEQCNTVVIHKTVEYETTVTGKTETQVNKVVQSESTYEENTFELLRARRTILKIAKIVNNKKTMGKLLKVSEKLDDIIINEKLD